MPLVGFFRRTKEAHVNGPVCERPLAFSRELAEGKRGGKHFAKKQFIPLNARSRVAGSKSGCSIDGIASSRKGAPRNDEPSNLVAFDPTPANAPVIRVQNLTKRFKKVTALCDVDLEIRRGEVVTLWGPNGAGKTTLLRCLLGILPFEGRAQVMGWDVKTDGKEVRRRIGYVPQEIRLHLDQTVWETVSFYARLRGVPADRAEKLIAEWGLDPAKKQLAQNLSGGMKQKLSVAIALLSDPPILFLDEPMSNLDADTRNEFEDSLQRLKKAGKTLLFCSHRYSEVRKIADRVVVLESGIKKSDGNADSAYGGSL